MNRYLGNLEWHLGVANSRCRLATEHRARSARRRLHIMALCALVGLEALEGRHP